MRKPQKYFKWDFVVNLIEVLGFIQGEDEV